MMNTMQKTMLALAVLATTSLSVQAESVDVRVIGTITPSACTPNLAGGGTIDYGAINPGSLSDTAYNVLPVKEINFSISCDAPAKAAIRVQSQRPGTLAGGTEWASGHGKAPVDLLGRTTPHAAGLGLDGTDKIGGFTMSLDPATVTADSVSVDTIWRWGATDNWAKNAPGSLMAKDLFETSWAPTGTLVPVAFEQLNGTMKVQAYLNKKSELDTSKPVVLDGLANIELVYL